MYGRIHTLDNDVGSDARQWLATLRPGLQHISATGLSSDPYGYAAGENLPLNSTAVPDDTRPWPSNTSLRALQGNCAAEGSLYTKALQIAALEALTNALDYDSLPSSMHMSRDTSCSEQSFPRQASTPQVPQIPSTHLLAAGTPRPAYSYAHVHELLTGAAAKQPQRATDNVPFRRPQWAGSDWHPKASLLPSAHSKAASKGTGVFLPYNYDDPVAATLDLQPLDWSHMYSSSLHASRDNASPRSELSRIDSSFSCQSSETDCSFIAAHGLSIPSKFPAGDARRVVGSKIGALPDKRAL